MKDLLLSIVVLATVLFAAYVCIESLVEERVHLAEFEARAQSLDAYINKINTDIQIAERRLGMFSDPPHEH